MDWELTDKPKGPCTACGSQPVDEKDQNRPPLAMIHAIGLDINWGEELNLCQNCVGHIADLVGRVSDEKIEALESQVALLTKQRDKANKELGELQPLVEKIREGAKAKKKIEKKVQEL